MRYSPSYLKEALLHRAARVWGQPFRESVDRALAELKFARVSRREGERLARLGGRKGLKLHLGCGPDVRPGWVNCDLNLNGDGRPGNPEYFNLDLRRGIPLPDGSCSLVYSSHVWEHLSNRDGLRLFGESHRVLEPGGTFRIALPHQEKMCRVYLERDWTHVHRFFNLREMFPGVDPSEVTYGDFLDVALYQYGEHVCFYDEERTVRILRSVGFRDVEASEYVEGFDVDDEMRRFGSFYVTAVKG